MRRLEKEDRKIKRLYPTLYLPLKPSLSEDCAYITSYPKNKREPWTINNEIVSACLLDICIDRGGDYWLT